MPVAHLAMRQDFLLLGIVRLWQRRREQPFSAW
jgi:hypothetical protein